MAVITIGNDYAEWTPCGSAEKPGCGRILLRSATHLTGLALEKMRASGAARDGVQA